MNALDPVQALTPQMTGRWAVRTRRTTHLFDLDTHTYIRIPDHDGQAFDHDRALLQINRIDRWPAVGARFLIWVDDPDLPDLLEQWRVSSTIRQISPTDPTGELDSLTP